MDIETARFNMVEQQVRPWNVLNQDILDLLFSVKREQFVAANHQLMAFTDVDLPITLEGKSTGENMFSPKVEARFMQALGLKKHESVVEVGAGSGYMAALLGSRAGKVLSLEIHEGLAKLAQANLKQANFANVLVQTLDASTAAARSLFLGTDAIVLSGSVEIIPKWMLDSLNVGGRLAAIVGQSPAMTAEIHTRISASDFRIETLFETDTKALHGFPTKARFTF